MRKELRIAQMARDLRVERAHRLAPQAAGEPVVFYLADNDADSSFVVDKAVECGLIDREDFRLACTLVACDGGLMARQGQRLVSAEPVRRELAERLNGRFLTVQPAPKALEIDIYGSFVEDMVAVLVEAAQVVSLQQSLLALSLERSGTYTSDNLLKLTKQRSRRHEMLIDGYLDGGVLTPQDLGGHIEFLRDRVRKFYRGKIRREAKDGLAGSGANRAQTNCARAETGRF